MFSTVCDQIWWLRKGLTTNDTFVRFFSCKKQKRRNEWLFPWLFQSDNCLRMKSSRQKKRRKMISLIRIRSIISWEYLSKTKVNWIYPAEKWRNLSAVEEEAERKCVKITPKTFDWLLLVYHLQLCIFNASFLSMFKMAIVSVSQERFVDIWLIRMFIVFTSKKEREERKRNKQRGGRHLPVWIYVCFFISDFWWKRFPQWRHE